MFLLGRYLNIPRRTMDAITAHTMALLLITRYERKEGEEDGEDRRFEGVPHRNTRAMIHW